MQKHPMYSVKEAAAALGCDERWVREQLNQGQLKGEKKSIGMKDKWFVYRGEVEQALARKGITNALPTPDHRGDQQFFGVEDDDVEPIDAEVKTPSFQASDNNSLAELVRLIANEFAEKLDEQKSLTFQLQRELEDKDRQLKLLPDLQKKAEEANLKEFELEALKKQLEEVQTLKDKAEVEAERARQLVDVIPELRQQVETEKSLKEQTLVDLTEQLKALEQKHQEAIRAMNEERVRKGVELDKLEAQLVQAEEHKKAAELAQIKIDELERLVQENRQSEEEKEMALEELRRLQEEKDAELVAAKEQVAELSKPKSWLRRFFLGGYA